MKDYWSAKNITAADEAWARVQAQIELLDEEKAERLYTEARKEHFV
ncbi:hypothetical protein [Bacteroides sp.]|nr:hypothetical protein [Bacteroides sp.]